MLNIVSLLNGSNTQFPVEVASCQIPQLEETHYKYVSNSQTFIDSC